MCSGSMSNHPIFEEHLICQVYEFINMRVTEPENLKVRSFTRRISKWPYCNRNSRNNSEHIQIYCNLPWQVFVIIWDCQFFLLHKIDITKLKPGQMCKFPLPFYRRLEAKLASFDEIHMPRRLSTLMLKIKKCVIQICTEYNSE